MPGSTPELSTARGCERSSFSGGSAPQRYENFRAAAHWMVQLLHQDIISATPGDDRKTLALAFGDTSVLELYDDSDHYESFVI